MNIQHTALNKFRPNKPHTTKPNQNWWDWIKLNQTKPTQPKLNQRTKPELLTQTKYGMETENNLNDNWMEDDQNKSKIV